MAPIGRAALVLGIPAAQLQAAVDRARLPEWGLDAHHERVYRWLTLVELAEQIREVRT